jgi:general secretion pathway protein J
MAQPMARRAATGGRRAARGFTLVELLVALVVMALLSLMSWRGLDAMGRAQSQTQARADDVQALQNGLAQWGADLDAMATELGAVRNVNSLAAPMEWNGRMLRITRLSTSAGVSGLRVVGWMVGDDQGRKVWLRWQSPLLQSPAALQQAWLQAGHWAQSPEDDTRAFQVSIVPLVDWQVYYYRGDAWTNPGSSSDAITGDPDGVRLQLTLPAGLPLTGTITRDWVRPTALGNKS